MSSTLLLADDSKTMQKVFSITFAQEKYEVVVVGDGEAALLKAKELVPALVVVDAVMPGRNGYEVCAAIKQDPALASTKVLLLAGSFEPFDEARAKSSGADDFLTKPFETQALIDKVNVLVTGSKGEPMPNAIPGRPLTRAVAPVIPPVVPSAVVAPVARPVAAPVKAPAATPPAAPLAVPQAPPTLATPPRPLAGAPATAGFAPSPAGNASTPVPVAAPVLTPRTPSPLPPIGMQSQTSTPAAVTPAAATPAGPTGTMVGMPFTPPQRGVIAPKAPATPAPATPSMAKPKLPANPTPIPAPASVTAPSSLAGLAPSAGPVNTPPAAGLPPSATPLAPPSSLGVTMAYDKDPAPAAPTPPAPTPAAPAPVSAPDWDLSSFGSSASSDSEPAEALEIAEPEEMASPMAFATPELEPQELDVAAAAAELTGTPAQPADDFASEGVDPASLAPNLAPSGSSALNPMVAAGSTGSQADDFSPAPAPAPALDLDLLKTPAIDGSFSASPAPSTSGTELAASDDDLDIDMSEPEELPVEEEASFELELGAEELEAPEPPAADSFPPREMDLPPVRDPATARAAPSEEDKGLSATSPGTPLDLEPTPAQLEEAPARPIEETAAAYAPSLEAPALAKDLSASPVPAELAPELSAEPGQNQDFEEPSIVPPEDIDLGVSEADASSLIAAPLATSPSVNGAGSTDEATLRAALAGASRELIEKIAWEVVPDLAEQIIREELERLISAREG